MGLKTFIYFILSICLVAAGVRIFPTENQGSADTGGLAVRGRSLAGIAGSYPAGVVDVSCEYCMLSDRGLCVHLKFCLSDGSWVLRVLGLLIANICHQKVIRSEIT
jgi:hypothetical protein